MLSSDAVNLAILWGIGLLALVQTINARGAIRLSLSAIATIVILILAVLFTYLKMNDYREYISPTATGQGSSLLQQSVSSRTEKQENRESVSLEAYIAKAQKIAGEAMENAKDISAFDKIQAETSESVRETAENKALSLRNQTAKINQQATELFHPHSVSDLHMELVHATENLRLAGYSLHAYTTLEEDSLRDAQAEQYLRQASIARKSLESYLMKLRKLHP